MQAYDSDVKAQGLIDGVVVTADQQRSRSRDDDVPRALAALSTLEGFAPGWERTVGDEIQAVTTEPRAAVRAVEQLVRLGGWQVGLGVGGIEVPLPASTREGRGQAFVDARDAVERAKSAPVPAAATGVGAEDIEAALWLYCAVLGRRTDEGWQAATLLADGLTQSQIADRLGVSASAVSQRVGRAAVEVTDAGAALLARLLDRALTENVRADP